MIRNIIGKWKTLVRPGVDKLRNEHLKDLIGHQSKQLLGREKDFAMSLAKIVEILANGLFPVEVAAAFSQRFEFLVAEINSECYSVQTYE